MHIYLEMHVGSWFLGILQDLMLTSLQTLLENSWERELILEASFSKYQNNRLQRPQDYPQKETDGSRSYLSKLI